MTEAVLAKKKPGKLKHGTRPTRQKSSDVSIPAVPWDRGADGPANRIGLVEEPRGEVDEQTGEIKNPNSVRGVRRRLWVERYQRQGKLTQGQLNAARHMLDASEGRSSQDPLSALKIDRQMGKPDPQAAAFDARRRFHAMWERVPNFCRPVIEHVVLNNRSIGSMGGCYNARAVERHMDRLRRGLDSVRG